MVVCRARVVESSQRVVDLSSRSRKLRIFLAEEALRAKRWDLRFANSYLGSLLPAVLGGIGVAGLTTTLSRKAQLAPLFAALQRIGLGCV